jgi:polyisoprenoid-binding protein YceI
MKKFFVFLVLGCGPVIGQQLRVDTTNSFITYEASHAVHDWSGTTDAVQGVVIMDGNSPSRMAIAASVASFNSKNSNRDAHALEVLDALSFPKVSFYGDDFLLTGNDLAIKGKINFHGVDIPIETISKWVKKDDVWILDGTFSITPSQFDIDLPSFMLVKMRDNIQIYVHLELRTFAP